MRTSVLVLFFSFAAVPLVAQSPASPPVATPTAAPGLQLAQAQEVPRNVRLELTITDTYTGEPSSKTVTMLIESGRNSMIRTSNRLPSGAEVNLNVDAVATILSTSAIRAQVTFEYTPAQQDDTSARFRGMPAELHESLWVVLRDGQKTMVSESADPATDRKVTVELMATRVQ